MLIGNVGGNIVYSTNSVSTCDQCAHPTRLQCHRRNIEFPSERISAAGCSWSRRSSGTIAKPAYYIHIYENICVSRYKFNIYAYVHVYTLLYSIYKYIYIYTRVRTHTFTVNRFDNRNYRGQRFPQGTALINITSDDSFAIDRKMRERQAVR